jgi:hypothetical protein
LKIKKERIYTKIKKKTTTTTTTTIHEEELKTINNN